MKVSVIIPVYNVQPCLERCVQSVLGQTYKDVEIILVDDGSTDGSGHLCDEFASRIPVVSVIHQHNQGISVARNNGLTHATGDYVVFIDADDAWLMSDGLQILVQKAEAAVADLVVFKGVHIWDGDKKEYTQNYNLKYLSTLNDSSEIFSYLVRSQQFSMSACFIMVRRQLLVEHEILFPVGLISEDVYWSLHLWQYVKSVIFTNIDFYGYFHRKGSVTTSVSIKTYESYDKIFTYWKSQCDAGCNNAAGIRIYLADMWINRGYGYFNILASEREEAVRILEKHSDLLHYGFSPKSRRARRMIKLFGVKTTVELLGWYWRIRKLVRP